MGATVMTLFCVGAIVAIMIADKKGKNKAANGMTDTPVSLNNILRGVANGWYTAQLTRVNGQPAIRLSGMTTNDEQYVDVYPISEEDWQTLKAKGFPVDL